MSKEVVQATKQRGVALEFASEELPQKTTGVSQKQRSLDKSLRHSVSDHQFPPKKRPSAVDFTPPRMNPYHNMQLQDTELIAVSRRAVAATMLGTLEASDNCQLPSWGPCQI
ncbi:unnamed protein product [Symbiodinium natans]|uniref:DUF4116 domain-containing protein n=1 Tax=Symbiodinium natans TaxID=878477 RepID=A0A812Q7S0_9DINO|nr:unnamed protein product [Symbiodinium natans]